MSLSLRAFIFVILLLTSTYAWAQQQIPVSQYMLTTLAYNPSFAGFSNSLCLSALHRQQWLGFKVTDGESKTNVAPQTSLILAEMPIDAIHGGLGLSIQSTKIGYMLDTRVSLAYSYHLETDFGRFGLGLQANMNNWGIDFAKLKPSQEGDPAIDTKGAESRFLFDFGVGGYFAAYKNYFIGLSINNIVTQKKEQLSFKSSRHFSLNGGYNFSFAGAPSLEFTATTLFETDFVKFSWDFSALTTYQKRFWGGLSYRWGEAFTILAGVNIKQFRIGVSYDILANSLIKASSIGGGFEIFLKYCFDLSGDKVNTNYKNARYL